MSSRDVLQAILRSYKAGYLNEDEFNMLLRQVVAIILEKELEARIGSHLTLHARLGGNRHSEE